jgi:hypothetical protein
MDDEHEIEIVNDEDRPPSAQGHKEVSYQILDHGKVRVGHIGGADFEARHQQFHDFAKKINDELKRTIQAHRGAKHQSERHANRHCYAKCEKGPSNGDDQVLHQVAADEAVPDRLCRRLWRRQKDGVDQLQPRRQPPQENEASAGGSEKYDRYCASFVTEPPFPRIGVCITPHLDAKF